MNKKEIQEKDCESKKIFFYTYTFTIRNGFQYIHSFKSYEYSLRLLTDFQLDVDVYCFLGTFLREKKSHVNF
jgi:hypothetical protein